MDWIVKVSCDGIYTFLENQINTIGGLQIGAVDFAHRTLFLFLFLRPPQVPEQLLISTDFDKH